MAFQSSKPLQPRADCPENFELIRSWLSKCDKHPLCARVPLFAPEPRLPTRLIDLGVPKNQDDPRLISSEDLNQSNDCRYVALSHCWGAPGKVPKTHTNTLQKQQEKIIELSKTFRDAIQVTREIGIRYLWIDSICIVQDDVSDFQRECAIMHLVYAHAYCVLSAQDARDGDDGLFIPRELASLTNETALPFTFVLNGPLSTRGWAFQEHQLSTRIVHFTKLRISWECRACVSFEDRPSLTYRSLVRFPDRLHEKSSWRLFDGRHEKYDLKDTVMDQTRQGIYIRWLKAMEIYSERVLTYDTDKLCAISGLVSAVALLTGDDAYFAGIWKADIIRGLLWRCASIHRQEFSALQSLQQENTLLSPTWSWASRCHGVRFGGLYNLFEHRDVGDERDWAFTLDEALATHDDSCVKIEVRMALSRTDPYGQVSSGQIRASGYAARIKVRNVQNNRLNYDERLRVWLDFHVGADQFLEALFFVLYPRDLNLTDICPTFGGLVLLEHAPATYYRIGVFCSDFIPTIEFSRTFVIIE